MLDELEQLPQLADANTANRRSNGGGVLAAGYEEESLTGRLRDHGTQSARLLPEGSNAGRFVSYADLR